MKTKTLVIAGAYYFDNENKQVLIPHFTGEFWAVDCTRYVQIKELQERYNKQFIQENKDNYILVDGVKYYYAEYGVCTPCGQWDLLSDLSGLRFEEENCCF